MKTLIKEIASVIDAYHRCIATNNDFAANHLEALREIEKHYLPSGSGIDAGTKIDVDVSGPDKVILTTSYHHMNEAGFYDGWTEHTITVTPSLIFDFNLKISGPNRNDIKEYLHEVFQACLSEEQDKRVVA